MKKFLLVFTLVIVTTVCFSQEPMKLASDEAKAKIEKLDKEISFHKDEVKRHYKEITKLTKEKKNLEKVVKSIKKI